jgi:hypothetical protein
MPTFNKTIYFPGKKFRGEMSQTWKSDNIVYVEFETEVRAYDNIKYPGLYANKIIGKINRTNNEEKIQSVWQGDICAWRSTSKVELKRPDPTKTDDLPF